MKQFNKRGFTIVELLIVIAIILILVLIVTVLYRGVTERADDAAIRSDFDSISDRIDLKTLDDDAIPAGGATSSGTGTATDFTGISVRVTKGSYDTNVTNLYYCAGDIGGEPVYAMVARSKSGEQLMYKSNAGITTVTGFTMSIAPMAATVCTAAGFSAPYTYSYGYLAGTGWSAWANQ